MSQETVELVKRGFEALQQGDLALFEEWTTPDLVIVQPPEVPDVKTYEGRTAVAEAWQDWPDQWEDFRLDLIEVIDVSDDIAVSVTRHRGRGRESGIEMDFEVFYVHRLRDGKLARMDMFFSREQALEAAGLSEQAMSQENVELYYRVIDAVNRRDLDAVLALMERDVEAVSRLVSVEGGYHGHEGMRRWWENLLEAFPDFTIEIDGVRELGDVTVAALRIRGHGASSDAPFDISSWQAVGWRQGKCIWWRMFDSQDEALEAVGLSEQDAHADP